MVRKEYYFDEIEKLVHKEDKKMEPCTNDACWPVKKTILATKKIMEELFEQLKEKYPGLIIEDTFTTENEEIVPKIGIFPSSIIRLSADNTFPQPLKIMYFINVLNAQEQEIELSPGWILGPGADEEKEDIYLKLLDVVFMLKEERGPIYKGKLEKESVQNKVKEFFSQTLEEYRDILESLAI